MEEIANFYSFFKINITFFTYIAFCVSIQARIEWDLAVV